MIHAGTDLKWMVTVDMNGFDINEDDMELTIKNKWGQTKYSYKASDFFSDGEGHWFFTMPNVGAGIYYAYLDCYRGDHDFPEGYQRVTDVQKLVSVEVCSCQCDGGCDCGCEECECCGTDGMKVTYERVWTVNFIDGCYLADCYGNPILDAEGNLIRFSDKVPEQKDVRIDMTAAEFKHWMDDRDENGEIDTRREIEDALGGIDDQTELTPMTADDANAMTHEIFGI